MLSSRRTEEEIRGCFISLCSFCHEAVSNLCLFFVVQWVGTWSVAFPGYTHMLF